MYQKCNRRAGQVATYYNMFTSSMNHIVCLKVFSYNWTVQVMISFIFIIQMGKWLFLC